MCNLYKITAAVEAMPVMLDVADIPDGSTAREWTPAT